MSQDHARDMLAAMKPDELSQYQGVVAVGGDGVFQVSIGGLLLGLFGKLVLNAGLPL